ncbi:MAG: hypothetical protein M3033_17860 [Acidobacteriota bacterium]|nr:hypothetical protein [Acidobacteriota bacterium]
MHIINEQEADYTFSVTVRTEKSEVGNVSCNLILPKEIAGEIYLQLFLTKKQYDEIESNWKFSAVGERNERGLTYQKIIADDILLTAKQIHADLFVITGEPRNLYLESHWSFFHEARKPIVEFQLTPSILLKPFRSAHNKNEYLYQASIKLCDGNTIVFDDEEYRYQDEKKNLITANSLVARCKSLENGNQENVQKVSDLLEDVLLITSFAEGQRCVCLGWKIYDHQMERLYFRRDKVVPLPLEDFWLNKLIEPEDTFKDFLQTAYKNFCSSKFQPNIRRAINSLFKRRETFESEFMNLYAGLESLVLGFRKFQGLEFVFSTEDEWNDFEAELKKWIKDDSLLKGDSKLRSSIYENVKALQRQSFGSVFKKMLKFYNIENELDDLWNITGNREGWSISEIRNKLVHGETFVEPPKHRYLGIAIENLRWVLNRLLLVVLGWNIEKSDVSKTKLANKTAYEIWQESKKYLST